MHTLEPKKIDTHYQIRLQMKIKILALISLLLLQACAVDPKGINYGDRLKFTGGSTGEAREKALAQCKKSNPFVFEVSVVKEHASIYGQVRDFKCQFWESESELTRPSSLQQRVMQARRFKSTEKEIHHALSAWIAHSGATGSVTAAYMPTIVEGRIVQPSGGKFFASFGKDILPILAIHGRYDRASTNDGVVIRIRTFAGDTEVFSPKLYQLIFNQIAQELFTEAIPIRPAEMQ
jgi:hypothetical protein